MSSSADLPAPHGIFRVGLKLDGNDVSVRVEAVDDSADIREVTIEPTVVGSCPSLRLSGGRVVETSEPLHLDEPTAPFHVRVAYGGGTFDLDFWDIEGHFDDGGRFVLEAGDAPRGCQVRGSGVGIPTQLSLRCRPSSPP